MSHMYISLYISYINIVYVVYNIIYLNRPMYNCIETSKKVNSNQMSAMGKWKFQIIQIRTFYKAITRIYKPFKFQIQNFYGSFFYSCLKIIHLNLHRIHYFFIPKHIAVSFLFQIISIICFLKDDYIIHNFSKFEFQNLNDKIYMVVWSSCFCN